MSADPEVGAVLQKLTALRSELAVMQADGGEGLSIDELHARRRRVTEILEEVDDAEELARDLEEAPDAS